MCRLSPWSTKIGIPAASSCSQKNQSSPTFFPWDSSHREPNQGWGTRSRIDKSINMMPVPTLQTFTRPLSSGVVNNGLFPSNLAVGLAGSVFVATLQATTG